ncbi:HupE/UreJ family protein [Hydrocarboniphaga sp.]|uniref:HupE/UreJ family protein n=1 Tax=Hydrocarboniphaga sp. TaxID=2033016 RepID=UPI003D0A9DA9
MSRRVSWRGMSCALLLLGSGVAQAHVKSESHSVWRVSGDEVSLEYSVPLTETIRLAETPGVQPPDSLLLDYFSRHIAVSAKAGDCKVDKPRAVRATDQFRRFEFTFRCPGPDGIELHASAFFDLIASHVNLAQIDKADGRFVEQMFTQDRQTLELEGEGEGLENAGFFEYVHMGLMHIFTGVDHMSFLLGLVLISRRTRDLVFVITGFTIGHSVTLALAVTGILRPHAEFIDALVALTIALIGAENIAVSTRLPGRVALASGGFLLAMILAKLAGFGTLPTLLLLGSALFTVNYLMISGHLRDAGRLRLVVTMVFGLIHGFGFAAGLLEFQMPKDRLAELLVGFNLGVEIGQLTVVFVLLALVEVLRRFSLALPRPIVVDGVAAALVALGLYWFIGRSF